MSDEAIRSYAAETIGQDETWIRSRLRFTTQEQVHQYVAICWPALVAAKRVRVVPSAAAANARWANNMGTMLN